MITETQIFNVIRDLREYGPDYPDEHAEAVGAWEALWDKATPDEREQMKREAKIAGLLR